MRKLGLQTAAATAFWGAVASLYVFMTWRNSVALSDRAPFTQAVLIYASAIYLAWVPLTVLIWNATAGWTISRLGWPQFLGRHVLFALAAAATHNAVLSLASMSLFALPAGEGFGQMFSSGMRNRSYTELIIYGGVVAAGQAWSMYERWRVRDAHASRLEAQASKLEAQLSQARLSALEAQIQPHFLFNSLHTIASLARDGRNADVVRLIADLSDLLRSVIDRPSSTRPFSEEVDFARRYLDIQQVRFEDRLRVTIDVSPAGAAVRVPALTLQPHVDNAVRHGISNSVKGGTIAIRARVEAGMLLIDIEDDGAGVPAEWNFNQTSGTGLHNLQSRLAILYSGRAALDASARPGGGFRVQLRIPAVE